MKSEVSLNADFKLSPGCFGTDIIQKCTKWSQMGVHGLPIGQILAKFQCACFLVRKIKKDIKHAYNIEIELNLLANKYLYIKRVCTCMHTYTYAHIYIYIYIYIYVYTHTMETCYKKYYFSAREPVSFLIALRICYDYIHC